MVVLGTFQGKAEGGKLLPGWEGSPTEYGLLSVDRAFKGSCGDAVKFYYLGGEMHLREMFRAAQREGLNWREWDPFYYYKDKSLDDPEMNVIYRCEEGDFYVKPQVGERYLVFLWYVPGLYQDYAVLGDNYGFLHVNEQGKVYHPDTKSYDTLPMLEEFSALEE